PQAWTLGTLFRDPGFRIDRLSAPAVFDHEGGRRPRVERRHVVAAVASEGHREPAFFAEREVEPLADIVERIKLDHHVMDLGLPGLYEGKAVVTCIDVQEARGERLRVIIAQAEAEYGLVEVGDLVDLLDIHHNVAEAERSGAESGDRAARLEGVARDL